MDNPFKNLSKGQKYGVVGGSIVVLGILEYTRHKSTGLWNPFTSKTTTPTDASGSAIDPVTGLPVSEDSTIDPLTGLTYLAEAQQYGSVQAAEAQVSAYGQSSNTGSGQDQFGNQQNNNGNTTSTEVYTSNAAWAQAATQGLADVGYNETEVATALGEYLTQEPLSDAAASLVRTAIAEYGPAPIGNLQIILQKNGGGGGKVKIPNLAGLSAGDAHNKIVALGLKPRALSSQKPDDKVIYTNPGTDAEVSKGTVVWIATEGVVKPPKRK